MIEISNQLKDKISVLNIQQKEAVEYDFGPALILAGAGSGKTLVITCRIAFLIESELAMPHEILGITFTNKAAKNMKEKVLSLTNANVLVTTFHSLGARILRQFSTSAGLQDNFSIYDASDQQSLIKECLKSLDLSLDDFKPSSIVGKISRLKDELIDPDSYSSCVSTPYEKIISRIYYLYQERLKENNAVDFSDLVMKTVKLFVKDPEVLSYYQERLKFFLVDEYQDTNYSQYQFIKILASRSQNLFVVGDPDQCIYSWRGADIRNILNFENDYNNVKVVKLEENYRSTETILQAANIVIQNNKNRKPKNLKTSRFSDNKIIYFQGRDPQEEADFILKNIVNQRNNGVPLSQIAILYRIHALSRILEEAFMREKIPYRIFGGTKFYDRKEIKDLLAYLRFMVNPFDRVSFLRIINLPRRGIGPATVKKIIDFADQNNMSFLSVLAETSFLKTLSGKVEKELTKLLSLLSSFEEELHVKHPSDLLQVLIDSIGYTEFLKKDDPTNFLTRQDNIKELFVSMEEYQYQNEKPSLQDYLEAVSILTELEQEKVSSDYVSLMTIHNSKGLEFDVCFLVGMEEGIFPYRVGKKNQEELEEERRLCYVAITRTKNHLFLTSCLRRMLFGSWKETDPSRFLSEISSDLIDNVSYGFSRFA